MAAAFSTATGHFHDGSDSRLVTSKHTIHIPVENLSAGGDIADRCVLIVPTGQIYTLTAVNLISQGTASGIDDSNTSVVVLKNGTNAIFTQTYNTGTAFPADGAATSPSLSGTYKVLAAGEKVKFSVTNGAAADTPLFCIQIDYTLTYA